MKSKLLYSIFIFVFFQTIYAENIYFKDGSYFTGDILKRTPRNIIVRFSNIKISINKNHIRKITKKKKLSKKLFKKLSNILRSKKSFIKKYEAIRKFGAKTLKYFHIIVRKKLKKRKKTKAQKQFIKLMSKITNRWKRGNSLPILHRLVCVSKYSQRLQYFKRIKNIKSILCFFTLCELSFDEEVVQHLCDIAKNDKYYYSKILREILQNKTSLLQYRNLIVALGKMGQLSSLDYLKNLANDKNIKISLFALDALGYSKHPTAVTFLFEKARDATNNSIIRRKAIYAIGKSSDVNSTLRLIPFLESEDKRISIAAQKALVKLSGKNFTKRFQWKKWSKYEEYIWPEIKMILHDIKNAESDNEVILGINKLKKYRDIRTLPEIHDIIKNDESDQVRKAACLYLRTIRHPKCIDILIETLDDKILSHLSYRLLRLIMKVKLPRSREIWETWWNAQPENNYSSHTKLLRLINSDITQLQYLTIKKIGQLQYKRALPYVREILYNEETSEYVKIEAINVIRILKDTRSLTLLRDIKNYDSKNISIAAELAINNIIKD